MCHRLDNSVQQSTTEQERTRQPAQRVTTDDLPNRRRDAVPEWNAEVREEELESEQAPR